MPKINVYLPDELAEAVKDAGVPVSAVCQRALEQAVRRVTAIRAVAAEIGPANVLADPPIVNFTKRAMSVLRSAQASAGARVWRRSTPGTYCARSSRMAVSRPRY